MAAYLKDVENNTRDMTAEKIIKEKLNSVETKELPQNCNRMPPAAPETVPRFKIGMVSFELISITIRYDRNDKTVQLLTYSLYLRNQK